MGVIACSEVEASYWIFPSPLSSGEVNKSFKSLLGSLFSLLLRQISYWKDSDPTPRDGAGNYLLKMTMLPAFSVFTSEST
jgi:hypothetical protein